MPYNVEIVYRDHRLLWRHFNLCIVTSVTAWRR